MSSRKENLRKYFNITINGKTLNERINELESTEKLINEVNNATYKAKLIKRRNTIRRLLSNRGIYYHVESKQIEFSNTTFCKSKEWKRLKYFALLLYGNYCSACGNTPDIIQLSVDHIFPKYDYPHLALEMTNLQVLCTDCNNIKDETDLTDWRTFDQKERAIDWVKILSNELRERRSNLQYSI